MCRCVYHTHIYTPEVGSDCSRQGRLCLSGVGNEHGRYFDLGTVHGCDCDFGKDHLHVQTVLCCRCYGCSIGDPENG